MPRYDPGSTSVQIVDSEDGKEAARLLCGILKSGLNRGEPVDAKRLWRWFANHRRLDKSSICTNTPEDQKARAECDYDIQQANAILQKMGGG